jgi:hypothetical protein
MANRVMAMASTPSLKASSRDVVMVPPALVQVLRLGSRDVRDVGLRGAGCDAVEPDAGVLELEQPDPVVVRVDEPGRQREADVGDAVDGAQLGQVLELDASGPQPGDLAGQVLHPPGRLGHRLAGPGGALGDHQPAVAATGEGEELGVLQQDLQAEGVAVEAAGRAEVGDNSITSIGC